MKLFVEVKHIDLHGVLQAEHVLQAHPIEFSDFGSAVFGCVQLVVEYYAAR